MDKPLNQDELEALGAALLKPAALTEIGLLLVVMGLAWLIVWRLKRATEAHNGAHPMPVMFGRNVFDGVLFPVLSLLLALAARPVLPRLGVAPAVFKLVIPVLIALVVIRLTVRVLRAGLPSSKIIKLVERSVSWIAWIGSILWVTGVLPVLMDSLDDVRFKVGNAHVTVLDLLQGALTALVVLVLALWVSSAVEARLLRSNALDLSLRKIAVNVTRASLLFIGLMFSLSAAGVDLTALGVLGGAVGVGIGFGLQKLASNYVSGFVILAERSLRIGDMVKVDNFEGRISDIKTRYTVIRSLGGKESVVPNEMLITQRVENSSLADPRVSVSTVVQVAYGTDLDVLIPQLVDVVKTCKRVLADPGPSVQLSNFAADGLELTVYFWIADPENGTGGVKSDVNLAILRTLNGLGIDIPFPQRVMHHITEAVPPEAKVEAAPPAS
ncbi:mechanosensitive ion channel [Paucibacter sp. R3-3]|uniref:Mechanosensitive ion channel n=1 Tax=Roseateles agri TaxID=3098619 RepID=A0ABU5DH50_9BURK|nr:mechanosensitive ion channel domain-containing protein [Paucibacter sp. R3-3]MDY0745479.1 mechanosensitive ion channel [Paucibacter sp. R3-3]